MASDIREKIKDVILRSLELEASEEQMRDINNIEELGVELSSVAVLIIIINLEKEFDMDLDEQEITPEVVKDISALEKLISGKGEC